MSPNAIKACIIVFDISSPFSKFILFLKNLFADVLICNVCV
jgi:hypothetical protein